MSRSSGQGQGHRGKQTGFTSITSLKYTLVDGGGPTLIRRQYCFTKLV